VVEIDLRDDGVEQVMRLRSGGPDEAYVIGSDRYSVLYNQSTSERPGCWQVELLRGI
jgi:hypothetical protein